MSTVHRKFPFAMVPEWILYHPGLSDRAVRLWAVLARHGTDAGARCPGRARLAMLCRCSTKSIDRAKDELELVGALVVKSRWKPGQKGTPREQLTNEYHLVDNPPTTDMGDASQAGTNDSLVAPLGTRVSPYRESFTEKTTGYATNEDGKCVVCLDRRWVIPEDAETPIAQMCPACRVAVGEAS